MQDTKRLSSYTKLLVSIVIVVIICVSSVVSAPFFSSVMLHSSGSIAQMLPLHTEDKYVLDSQNNVVLLRGVWVGMFADSSTGWFSVSATEWNENDIRYTFQTLRDDWNVNVINFFFWGDWWLENKATTLSGTPTPIGCRDAIIRVVEIAQDYGIYVEPRLYGWTNTEGRQEGVPFQPTYSSVTPQDFADFWGNVASYLKDYPNVIYHLYDEPSGENGGTLSSWFSGCDLAITAIRAAGSTQLISIHWGYCGDMGFIINWVNGNYTTNNIIFSEHIYRSLGSYAANLDYPIDISSIRTFLTNDFVPPFPYTGTGTKYLSDTFNVPIWVSAVGTADGTTNDDEYIAFRNTLEVLNEIGVGYVVYSAHRTEPVGCVLTDAQNQIFSGPNRVGQALIDAIAGVSPPPTHTLSVYSNYDPIRYTLNGTIRVTPKIQTLFDATYNVTFPSAKTIYTHNVLLGSTSGEGGTGSGYYSYTYCSGPHVLNQSSSVSTIYFYAAKEGNAKLAIYTDSGGSPNALVAHSEEQYCTVGWNKFNIPTVTLDSGSYHLAIKIDTNGMIVGSSVMWHGKFQAANYDDNFPNTFNAEGGTGSDPAIYIPSASLTATTIYFSHWSDGLTDLSRSIYLTNNVTIAAYYSP